MRSSSFSLSFPTSNLSLTYSSPSSFFLINSSYIINMAKHKISKIVRALQMYMARIGANPDFPGTYFPPGGGGVPRPTEISVKRFYRLQQCNKPLDRLSPVNTRAYPPDKIVTCFSNSVKVSSLLFSGQLVNKPVDVLHSCADKAGEYADNKCQYICHSRGPPLPLRGKLV